MGETQDRPFQLSFNSSLRVDFQGARVTSDGGLILARELDERLGLSALVECPREPLPLADANPARARRDHPELATKLLARIAGNNAKALRPRMYMLARVGDSCLVS